VIQVKPRQSRLRLSKVDPSPRQAESSEPRPNQVGMGQSQPSRFGPKLSRVNPRPSRVEWQILSRPESAGAKPSWSKPMFTQVGPCPCRVEPFEFDMESSGLD